MAKNSKTEDGHFKEHAKVYDIILNACKNWEEKLGKDIDWTKVFAGIKKKEKLSWFQTKNCCIILVTNSILKDMGDANFAWQKKTIFHFLCQCEPFKSFWVRFEMCLKKKSFNWARFSINPTLILFRHDGKTTTDEDFDFILLHAKFFVYKCRLNKLKPMPEA